MQNKNFNMVRLLIKNGADVNVKDRNGWPVWIIVAQQMEESFAKFLIQSGLDIHAKNTTNKYLKSIHYSMLHLAAIKGWEEVAKLLIRKGADLNPQEEKGYTPLIFAVINGKIKIVKLLLEKGADKNLKTKREYSVYIPGPNKYINIPVNFTVLQIAELIKTKIHSEISELLREK